VSCTVLNSANKKAIPRWGPFNLEPPEPQIKTSLLFKKKLPRLWHSVISNRKGLKKCYCDEVWDSVRVYRLETWKFFPEKEIMLGPTSGGQG
jgi:hypothetical protein